MELSRSGIPLNDTDDQMLWSGGDCSGYLIVKNVYAAITNTLWNTNISGWRKQLWSLHLAPKIKLFTWLLIENKLNTWDILQRKGWVGPNICQLCHNEETSTHLFIKCSFTRQVWDIITLEQNLKTIWDETSLTTCFDYWSSREHNLIHLPSLVCRSIWLDMNKKIFENGPHPQALLHTKHLECIKFGKIFTLASQQYRKQSGHLIQRAYQWGRLMR